MNELQQPHFQSIRYRFGNSLRKDQIRFLFDVVQQYRSIGFTKSNTFQMAIDLMYRSIPIETPVLNGNFNTNSLRLHFHFDLPVIWAYLRMNKRYQVA